MLFIINYQQNFLVKHFMQSILKTFFWEDEIDFRFFDKGWISSATYSAWEHLKFDSDPSASAEDNFIDDELIPLNDWVSTNDGLLDYLKTRYHEAVDDPCEDDDHTFLFYIGNTSECAYKTFEEFKADLDLDYISDLFKKCWERSCNTEQE